MFKLFRKFKSISYYGFPVGVEEAKEKSGSQRGVALLIALMTIMLMVALVTDMIITSTVNIEMAVASRDRMRAEYLAKSGFNFAVFILSMSWGYDLFRASPQSPMKQDLQDNGNSIWSMANKLPPIGALTVELLDAPKKKNEDSDEKEEDDPFKLKGVMNEEVRNTMKLFDTSFSIKISDEASKININECYKGRCQETLQMLIALFSCPAERSLLESKGLQPEQLAYRIKDFISDAQGSSPESGFSDKNAPYLNYTPSYTTKGVPFDSVRELKLVEGWDDELHTVFAPYLTAYPYPSAGKSQFSSPININTIKPELLSCLIPDARTQACAESFAQKMYKLKKDNSPVYKGSIKDTLSQLTCLGTDPSNSQAKDGTKIDPTTWFDQKSSVFRIEIDSNTRKQDRKLTAIVRRIMPQDKANQREQQQVKRSYQILHWKML